MDMLNTDSRESLDVSNTDSLTLYISRPKSSERWI